MAVEDPPWALQSDSHPASVVRHAAMAFTGSGPASFAGGVQATGAGGGHGVASQDSYVVTQSGTPGMSVVVSAGIAAIRGTQSAGQGVYTVYNDADTTLTIATADGTNPRNDLICLQVRDSAYSGVDNDARLVVVQGTPAASPADPSLSSTPNALVLARVRVNALASSITNANITDLRTHSYAHGSVVPTMNGARPSGASLYEGLVIYEQDSNNMYVYDGANWTPLFVKGTYTPTLTAMAIGTGGGATNTAKYVYSYGKIFIQGVITFGTSGATLPGGAPLISLPSGYSFDTSVVGPVAAMQLGFCTFLDASAGAGWMGITRYNTSTNVRVVLHNAAGSLTQHLATSATVPFTWATGDSILWTVEALVFSP